MKTFGTPWNFWILAAPSLKEKKRRRTDKCAPFYFPPSVRQITVAQRRRTEAHRHVYGARAQWIAHKGPLLPCLKRQRYASEIKVRARRWSSHDGSTKPALAPTISDKHSRGRSPLQTPPYGGNGLYAASRYIPQFFPQLRPFATPTPHFNRAGRHVHHFTRGTVKSPPLTTGVNEA